MPDFRVFPGEHDEVLDRSSLKPEYDRPWFGEGAFAQAADVNEIVSQQNTKRQRIGDLIARDGDRVSGCEVVPQDIVTGEYLLTAGKLYVRGDVRSIGEANLTGVTVSGDVQIGVRIVKTIIDHEDDPDLLGQIPEAASGGEPGAYREILVLAWGWSDDGNDGDLYAVYNLRDGYVIDQTPPPSLGGINAQIAAYDYGAHENYIADGCVVTALGKIDADQVFSIGEGIANILGFKRTRFTSTRFSEVEAPDLETIDAEPQVYDDDSGSSVIEVNHAPINGVASIVITKEHSETINRGGVADTADLLSKPGVTKIITVDQGETHYDLTSDFLHDGDELNWSPGGAEPATSSSYDVTYEFLEAVAPDEFTNTHIKVSGGVDGGAVIINYSFKLPRVDRLGLDRSGNIVYIKGLSSREQPQPPITPTTLLSLCEVRNDWFNTPTIVNNGTQNITFKELTVLRNRLVDLLDLVAIERLKSNISSHEPTAKHAVFVDPFTSDRYRDAGEDQTAAVFNETCQLEIDATPTNMSLDGPTTLDFTSEVIVSQEYVTGCQKVNPYQVFKPLPLAIEISPSEDFWEETNETWLSSITRVFGQGSQSRVSGTQVIENSTTRAAAFLRSIPISFTVGNLGTGEALQVLTFDGIDVNPGGLSGDVDGKVSSSFNIPANVVVGIKEVYAEGESIGKPNGSARFEGRGVITDVTRQRISSILRWTNQSFNSDGSPGGGGASGSGASSESGGPDPLAQTFSLTEDRHVSGVEALFCVVGDTSKPVVCEIVNVRDGTPTRDVIAQTEIDMSSVIVGVWKMFTFNVPTFITAGVEYAFVFRTDDADHSMSVATRGEYDAIKKEWVGTQPYTVGVMLSSSNATTWTPHQNTDIAMRIYGAIFDPIEKVVDLGTFPVAEMSDFIAVANVFLPTNQTQMRFRATPDGENAQILESSQNWERTSFFTGNVQLEAILSGAAKVSPILSKDIVAIAGEMNTSGTYISRSYEMGTAVRQDVRVKTKLPPGSTLVVEIDKNDDVWQPVALAEAEALTNGDLDQLFTENSWTAATGGRLRLTMTGTPAARPKLSDLRSYSI